MPSKSLAAARGCLRSKPRSLPSPRNLVSPRDLRVMRLDATLTWKRQWQWAQQQWRSTRRTRVGGKQTLKAEGSAHSKSPQRPQLPPPRPLFSSIRILTPSTSSSGARPSRSSSSNRERSYHRGMSSKCQLSTTTLRCISWRRRNQPALETVVATRTVLPSPVVAADFPPVSAPPGPASTLRLLLDTKSPVLNLRCRHLQRQRKRRGQSARRSVTKTRSLVRESRLRKIAQ
mmetsp:Transcript_33553/g.84504  ORF Transcript_33553/g.84504 Transcript_33553/m.84504 type:complete len:231 (-) Transcript_33553:368-1060(-)